MKKTELMQFKPRSLSLSLSLLVGLFLLVAPAKADAGFFDRTVYPLRGGAFSNVLFLQSANILEAKSAFASAYCVTAGFFGFPCADKPSPYLTSVPQLDTSGLQEDSRSNGAGPLPADRAPEIVTRSPEPRLDSTLSAEAISNGAGSQSDEAGHFGTASAGNRLSDVAIREVVAYKPTPTVAGAHTDTPSWYTQLRDLLYAQTRSNFEDMHDEINETANDLEGEIDDLQDSLTQSIASAIETGSFTVSGNAAFGGPFTASSTVTFASLGGGILQTDANGVVSTTTVGAAGITADSLNFAQLADALILDAGTSINLNAHTLSLSGGTTTIQDLETTAFTADTAALGTTTATALTTGSFIVQDTVTTPLANGCVEVAGGVLTSIGVNCGTSSGGITSFNGLTSSSQTFATSSDANIHIAITSSAATHTLTPSWNGTLSVTRGGTGASTATDARSNLGLGSLAVLSDLSTFDTDDLAEGTDLYFTNSRAVTALTNQNISLFTNNTGYLTSVDVSDDTNLSVSATGLSLTGDALSLAAGYTIPLTASTTAWITDGNTNWDNTYNLFDKDTDDTDNLTEGTTNLFSQWGTSGSNISFASGNVGIGTTTPAAKLDVVGTLAVSGLIDAASGIRFDGLGTQSGKVSYNAAYGLLMQGSTAATADSAVFTPAGSIVSYNPTGTINMYFAGSVGIGTTSPTSRLTVFETSANPQQRISYDATRYAELQVDAAGDLTLSASGGSVWLLDENLQVCEGGACPTLPARIDASGNLIVEDTLVAGELEEQCATGYVWVPGSAKYGTQPGFCVMKYEAKNDGSNNAVSTAAGSPWVSISQESARATCQAIGPGYHLISEGEWMTIADGIAALPINDLDDDAGLQLATGHTDNAPASALASVAGDDPVTTSCSLMDTLEDANNAYAGGSCELRGNGTNTNGYTGTGEGWSSTGYASGAANKAQLRTHVLSNGEVLWDIAGNVWEWTDAISVAAEHPEEIASVASEWLEYTAGINYKGLAYARPADDGWNSANGIGRLYTDVGDTATAVRAFLRGGRWGDTSGAGVFALFLNFAPSGTYSYLGFRCAR